MRRIITLLAAGLCCVSVLSGCGGVTAVGPGATANPADPGGAGAVTAADPGATSDAGTVVPVTSVRAGKTAAATARAYVMAWAAEDAAAMAQLLTPGTRSSWEMGGGIGKWLLDQRGGYGDPLADQGRVLAVEEHGGIATADVAVAYRCVECAGDRLPDWPPAGSVAVAARLTLARGTDGRWLISYLDGSVYLAVLNRPTRTLLAAATSTAYAASMAATRTAQVWRGRATGTARSAGARASRTAAKVSLNATATALWAQWFPQPTPTPQPAVTK